MNVKPRFSLLTCINVFCFVLHIYCQVMCPTKEKADREECVIEVGDVCCVLAM